MNEQQFQNGLTSLADGLLTSRGSGLGTPVSQTLPSIINNRYNLIFNNRITLNELYIEHGLVQTLVDQPVDDAFRTGVSIISKELGNNLLDIEQYMDRENIWEKIMQTLKWSRLFGGAGLVVIAGLNPKKELDIRKINKYTKLDFYAADLWELNKVWTIYNVELSKISAEYSRGAETIKEIPYMFYGIPLHKSRVLAVSAKEAPSLMRPRMRGWGMSALERFLRSFNQYLKNQNVIYELLDEAKIDVFNLDQFKASLLTADGTAQIESRMQLTTMMKNYLNILVMDKEDKFEQKTMNFSGLGDILTQIRQGVASDMKMPITKLFGVSSAGFNSGEDDIENYNAMIQSEIRSKCKHIILKTLEIVCMKVVGKVPSDLDIEWAPLRVLSAQQEEAIKSRTLNRVIMAQQAGLMDMKRTRECVNKDNLLPLEIDENDAIYITPDNDATPTSIDTFDDGKDIDSANQKIGTKK